MIKPSRQPKQRRGSRRLANMAAKRALQKLQWLLQPKVFAVGAFAPVYGDITRLNTNRTILEALGAATIHTIISEFMGMLESSCAVYEINGDYATGIFSSGWCQFMDGASYKLCGTTEVTQALTCGKWHCHESCWLEAAKPAIDSGAPVDIECAGGIRLYAVPIRVNDTIIGAINFGYSSPPKDEQKLTELAEKYQVDRKELARIAREYQERPSFVIELAKHRLGEATNLIGLLVALRQEEKELQESKTNLEKRVQERTAELQTANQELEAFTYAVSHDLRAPLRGINGSCQAILEDYAAKLDAGGQELLHDLIDSSRDMTTLIDGLLRLSRSTQGELSREKVELSPMAEEILKTLRKQEPERLLSHRIAPNLVAFGDARLLKTALTNLLANAWKYTARQPAPHIELAADRQHGETVYQVSDNGAGFDMAYADKLFTPFQRLHPVSEFAGSGIGLATVQRIIHRHGGRIWAESRVGQGATFFFTLALKEGSQ